MIAFGISSIFFAILAVFIPFFGIFIAGLSGLLAWLSAGKGTHLGAAAVIINLVNICLLSPGYILIAGLEAHLRTPDQAKSHIIWLIVLFLQLSAIGVFIAYYALTKFACNKAKKAFRTKAPQEEYPNHLEQLIGNDDYSPAASSIEPRADELKKAVTPLTKTLIKKLQAGRKQDSKFWQSEFGTKQRDPAEIPVVGSRPHDPFLKKHKSLLQAQAVAISCIGLAFVLIIIRPDLFPYLQYSSVYNLFSKTFPEKHLDKFKEKQPLPPISTGAEKGKRTPAQKPPVQAYQVTDSQRNNLKRQAIVNKPQQQQAREKTPTAMASYAIMKDTDSWHIIELQSGETIITQQATVTKDWISILGSNGKERRINRNEMKNYKKTKL